MNQNDIKWEIINPIKFMDKEAGEVEVIAHGKFSYQITKKETFSAAATQANMDEETYAKGILLRFIIDEITKNSGKMVFGLTDIVKGENIILLANSKLASLGFVFNNITIEDITVTEKSKVKMKEIETNKIKAAITGKKIVNSEQDLQENNDPNHSDFVDLSKPAEETGTEVAKKNGVIGIVIAAIIAAVVMGLLFK